MADWERVGLAVEQHRALRFASREEAADTSGVAITVWQQLEKAKKSNYRPGTLARVERALRWPVGSIMSIADGGDVPSSDPDADPETLRRLEAVERRQERHESLLRRIAAHLGIEAP